MIVSNTQSPPFASVFHLDVSAIVGSEYLPLVDDVIRMVCVQVTIQLMVYLSGSSASFFTSEFALLLVYVVLGVMLYWLVVRKIVGIV
jgi:hypothetical protein